MQTGGLLENFTTAAYISNFK